MKRIVSIVVWSFCGLGLLLWLTQSFVNTWEPRIRSQLETGLGKTLKARVEIESITPSFLIHRIHLINVRILDDSTPPKLIFRAADIALTISLIDLPRAIAHRDPIESIGLVSVESPWLVLSPKVIQERSQAGREAQALPILFTLAWEQGTVQWKDPQAPHGAWTLYQSRGLFRIRGPRIDFATRGSMEAAETVRFEYSMFRHRWNAQAAIIGGNIHDAAAIIERVLRNTTQSPWRTMNPRGSFNLQLDLGGRHWPGSGDKPWNFLERGRLSFSHAEFDLRPNIPPIQVAGAIVLEGTRLNAANLTLTSAHRTLSISGSAWPFGPEAKVNLQATSKDFDLALISAYANKPGELEGQGNLDVHVEGPLREPDMTLQAHIAQGQIYHLPFQEGHFHARRTHGHWEFAENSIQVLDGRVALKGVASPQATDLQITAENVALDQQDSNEKTPWVQGRLNVSASLRGAADDLRASGSFWVTNFSWGRQTPDNLRGDFELTPNHFQAGASAEHSDFHLALEGSSDEDETRLDRLEIQMPSGAALTGEATLSKANHHLQGTLNGQKIVLPTDVPMLMRWATHMKGSADIRARLSGTLNAPKVQCSVISHDLTLGSEAASKASANFLWESARLSVPSFTLEPGVQGSWSRRAGLPAGQAGTPAPWILRLDLSNASAAWLSELIYHKPIMTGRLSGHLDIQRAAHLEGSGNLTLEAGRLGNWPISKITTLFNLSPTFLDLKKLSLDSSQAKGSFHGRAYWATAGTTSTLEKIQFRTEGRISSSEDKPLWDIPLLFVEGHSSWGSPWAGSAQIRASTIYVHAKPTEPLEATLDWDQDHLSWQHTHWGSQWSSNGTLHFQGKTPSAAAGIDLHDVPVAQYRTWFWTQNKESLDGHVSGHAALTGPIDDPSVDLTLRLDDGVWRAFHYQAVTHGIWSSGKWQPLNIQGNLSKGGQFDFRGQISPSPAHVQGSLTLTGLNLQPLGESLSFPKSLDGTASGTLTVNGPLDALNFTGHLEASPLVYGQSAGNAFRLENGTLDLTLAPAPDRTGVMRLAIAEGLFRTAEEQIRLTPGSYIDFAGNKEARLQVGTEIRNLHLGLFTIFGGLDLAGTWQIKPAGFAIQGDLQTRSLYINDYELEEGHVNADYYDSVLRFRPPGKGPALLTGMLDFHQAPQLKFTDFFISGKEHQGLKLTGDIGPSLWDFKMLGQGLDISTLSGLAGFPYPLTGTANVAIRGTGDLFHPHVDGTIDLQQGSALGLSFRTGSAAFVWQNYRMTFTRLLLSDPGRYTLTGSGIFPLETKSKEKPSDRTIDFSVRLQDSNLSLLQSFSSEVKQAKGSVDGILQIKGTPEQPILHGSLHVANGDVVGAHYFRHLENLNLNADFEGDQLLIREFRGKSGNGEFQMGGTIAFAGFVPRAYDLRADVTSRKGVDVTVPELAIPESPLAKRFRILTSASRADVKGHVTFQGPADAPIFQGEGMISNGHFSFPPSRKNPPPAAVLEWFRRINWDVDLHFSDGAWFENELVEANLTGTLHLKGPSDRLRVDGGMDISEGKISYLSLEFDIQQARFDVRSQEVDRGVINTPYVRGIAQSSVQAVDTVQGEGPADASGRIDINDTITLTIDYAPIDEIKPRLASLTNPNLSQEKLLARVTQLDTTNLTPQERNTLYQQQMVRVIDTSVATPLAKNILKRTGLVDNLRVSQVANQTTSLPPDTVAGAAAQSQSTSLLANTKYTFEKNLGSRLSLGYGVRFLETTTPDTLQNKLDLVNDVELSYRWFHNVYLRGAFDLPSSNPSIVPERKVTIEPRWRFGWWGNTNKPKAKPSIPSTVPADQ